MKKQAIIRGIWGEGRGHSDPDFEATIRGAKKNGDPVDKVYCFGLDNARMLERCGYEPEVLDERPRLYFNQNAWWHKFKIIEKALGEFETVLWQDFDVRLVRQLPSDFWQTLHHGPSLQAPLIIQRSVNKAAYWRMNPKTSRKLGAGVSRYQTNRTARLMPGGGYIYIRGLQIVRDLMGIMNGRQMWSDQRAMALYIDRLYGGWPGIQAYVAQGHEPKGYYYAGCLYLPPKPETYWRSGRFKGFQSRKYDEEEKVGVKKKVGVQFVVMVGGKSTSYSAVEMEKICQQ